MIALRRFGLIAVVGLALFLGLAGAARAGPRVSVTIRRGYPVHSYHYRGMVSPHYRYPGTLYRHPQVRRYYPRYHGRYYPGGIYYRPTPHHPVLYTPYPGHPWLVRPFPGHPPVAATPY